MQPNQQFGQPQSWQSGQPVYGNQFQQFAPQQQQQPTQQQPTQHQHAPSFDDAEDPRAFSGLAPRPRHLLGRTVIYMPKRVDKNAKGMDGQPKDTPNVYGALFVIDGGPCAFGDKQRSGGIVERPNTHVVQTPAYFDSVIVGEWEIAKALEAAVPPFGNGLVVGVIERGTKGNNPFMINAIEKGDPRRDLARQVYDAWRAGTWKSPEPEQIQATPGSMAAQPAQNAAGGFGAPQGQWAQPQPMGGQATAWTGQAAPQSAPPAQWAQPTAGPAAAAPQYDINTPAPGWDPNMWAQLPEANRHQVYQAMLANGGQPSPTSQSAPTGF